MKRVGWLIETLNGLETIKSTGAQSIMRKKWLKAISNQNEITSNVKKRSNLVANLARKPEGNDRAQAKAIHEGVCDIAVMNTYYFGKMKFNVDKPEQKKSHVA